MKGDGEAGLINGGTSQSRIDDQMRSQQLQCDISCSSTMFTLPLFSYWGQGWIFLCIYPATGVARLFFLSCAKIFILMFFVQKYLFGFFSCKNISLHCYKWTKIFERLVCSHQHVHTNLSGQPVKKRHYAQSCKNIHKEWQENLVLGKLCKTIYVPPPTGAGPREKSIKVQKYSFQNKYSPLTEAPSATSEERFSLHTNLTLNKSCLYLSPHPKHALPMLRLLLLLHSHMLHCFTPLSSSATTVSTWKDHE